MLLRFLFCWGLFLCLPFFGHAQCSGTMDEDGDGYFPDVDVTCPEYDPDDNDPCVPSVPFEVQIAPEAQPSGFCCEDGDFIFLNSVVISDHPINPLNFQYNWERSEDGINWSIIGTSIPFGNVTGPSLTIYNSLGLCDTYFRVRIFDSGCLTYSAPFTLDQSFPPTIASSSLCPTSLGECEKVCANSTVTYSLEKEEDQTAFWQVEGAEDFTINNGEVEVTWGEAGEGEVSVEVLADSIVDWSLDCGEGFYLGDVGGDHYKFAFASVSNNLFGPYEYAVDGSNDFEPFGFFPTYTAIQAISEGIHEITVRDNQGNSKTCEVEIKPINEIPFSPFLVPLQNIIGCDDSNGAVFLRSGHSNQGGSGHPVEITFTSLNTGMSYDTTDNLAFAGPGAYVMSNLEPGNYQLDITSVITGETIQKYFTIHCQDCQLSSSLCIDIQPEPQASFSTDPAPSSGADLSICLGQPIQFQNESTGSTSVVWEFGNGASTPAENPEYTYPEPGVYEVKLIARNDCFCADTTTMTVEVLDAQIPDIQCTGTVCQGDTATYSTSMNCNIYQWEISPNGQIMAGGTPADDFVTVAWTSGPSGFVQLQALGCAGSVCPDPVREEIGIIPGQVWAEGPQTVCPQQIAEYSVPDFGATDYTWYVPSNLGTILSGQGTPGITVEWGEHPGGTTPQLAQIEVEFENCFLGCSGQGSISVQMKQPSYITGPIEICHGSQATYKVELFNGNGNGSGTWKIVSETGGVVWESTSASSQVSPVWDFPAGQYLVRIISTSSASCSDDAGLNVTLLPPPPPVDGILGDAFICPQNWYSYEVESSEPDAIFSWQVTNGNDFTQTTGRTVNVQWGTTQPYTLAVSQIIGGAVGCPSEFVVKEIKKLPGFEIEGPAEICKGQTATYTTEDNQSIDYEWIVEPADAGGVLEGQGTNTVEVVWQKTGSASLRLIACGENTPLEVYVFGLPQPEVIAPDALCLGEVAEVTASQNFVFYEWKNEGGSTVSTLPNPDLSAGTFTLSATDQNGCTGEASFLIHEKPSPETSLTTPDRNICPQGDSTILSALQTHDGLSFSWALDGNPIGSDAPTLTAFSEGVYSLIATDIEGCTTSQSITLVECDSTSGGDPGAPNPDPDPADPTGSGCTPSEALDFFVNRISCSDFEFDASATNFIPGTMLWNFVDNQSQLVGTSNEPTTTFSFPYPGHFKYFVYAQVPDISDPNLYCSVGAQGTLTVPLKALFSVVESCPGMEVEFRDLSIFLPDTGITGWEWDFGDPTSGAANFSQNQHPTHVYGQAGTYTVTLHVTSTEGCVSSLSKTIEVHAAPDVDFALPSANCAATALEFSADVSANASQVEWDFGDPAGGDGNISNSETAWHAYPAEADYSVTLTAENIYGCANSIAKNVSIEANNLSGEISPNDPAPVCEGEDVNLQAPPGGVAWDWSDGSTNEGINTTESGVYKVTLTDANGCEYATEAVAVEIIPAPIATIRALELNEFGQPVAYHEDGYSACQGEDVFLKMVGQPKYTYEWSDGSTGDQLTLASTNGNLLPVGDHSFTVTVTDTETGCTAVEGPFPVTIHGAPSFVLIGSNPTAPICEGTEVVFSVLNPQPDLAYLWNTGQTGTEMTAVSAGTYLVQAVNSFGCSAKSQGIEIHAAPPVGAMPRGCFTSCEPIEICLPELPDLADIQWFIDGVEVPAPNGQASEWTTDQSGEYSVHLTSTYGCEILVEGLSLDIAPQSGDLFGEVYVDVDGNGQIDPNVDTLLAGAFVEIFQDNLLMGFQLTQNDGAYFFENFAVGEYVLNLNLSNLPTFEVVGQGTVTTQLSGCSFDEGFDFLVANLCTTAITDSLELSACPGSSAMYLGMEIPTGSSEVFTLTSFLGCDSMLTVSVVPLSVSEGNLELMACPDGSAEFMGMEIPTGETGVFILENQYGCDSVLTVSVSEMPVSVGSLVLSSCPDQPVIYGGQTLWPGDTEVFVLENHLGCDSLLTVTVNSLENDSTFINLEVCHGETTEYNGLTFSANDSEIFVFENYLGCDSVVQVSVFGLPEITFSLSTEDICHGTADGIITVDVTGGTPPYSCSLDGVNFQTKPDFVDLIGGAYTVWIQDAEGCLGSAEINIGELPPLKVLVEDYVLPCEEEQIVIRPVVPSHAGDLKWEWGDGSDAQFLPVTEAGRYAFSVEDLCAVEAREVSVDWGENLPEDFLYVPNAFSPNDDSVNDIFKTYTPEGADIQHFEFRVFDRWGGLMFETFEQKEGWDGYVDGSLMGTGVYVWYVRATVEYCGHVREVFWEGDVNLLR